MDSLLQATTKAIELPWVRFAGGDLLTTQQTQENSTMDNGTATAKAHTRVKLIKEFFVLQGAEAVQAFKSLTDLDKNQLASAIARASGLPESDCDFAHVEY